MTPFDAATFRAAAYDEMRRIIREQEPPKPSTRICTLEATATTISANRQTDPRRLRKALRGELDWIVMKCLDKDRNRRYETANTLVADLRRHLNHEPVDAGPPSAWYRLRKYARRNRTVLVTAAVVATALVAGTVVSTWEALRATNAEGESQVRLRAEQKARGEADRLLGEVTQERNRAQLARQEADRRATEAREVVDFLINDLIGAASPSRSQGEIPTVDKVLARADQNIAQKFANRPLIEASIRHALGKAYEELGQYPQAEHHAARAVELRLAGLGPEAADTIAAQNALGWALCRQEQDAKACALLNPILATARKALGPEHEETLHTMFVLAKALNDQHRHDESRALNEELLAIWKRVRGPEDPRTLAVMANLAGTEQHLGNLEKAKTLYEQVLAVELRVQPNHPNTILQTAYLASVYSKLGQSDRANDLSIRALEGTVRVFGLSHPHTRESLYRLFSDAKANSKRLQQLRPVLEQALERARRELGRTSRVTTSATDSLATLLVLLGRPDEAIALESGSPAPGDREALEPPELRARTRFALLLRDQGRFDAGRHLLEQTADEALRLSKKTPKPDPHAGGVRHLAQFLLGRWPGLAPGISPAARPPASVTIEAPFRATSPVADGRIAPGEYGPGTEATFDGNTNAGRQPALRTWKTHDDLSLRRMSTGYTDRSLFLAFQVRDQLIVASEQNAKKAWENDSVTVYINGDQVGNDMLPAASADGFTPHGNREGFQIIADAAGHQATNASFTNADWKVGTSRTPEGYIIEFEIPLALIDTRDGPEYVPARSGSELLVSFTITDNDAPVRAEGDSFAFGDEQVSPFKGGEEYWTYALRLVRRPEGR
jgi:tetratricopeptide (TPR) repeat protein